MKIVKCNGGLGNQTFQYIFSRFVELEGKEPCYLDNASFYGRVIEHNGFELSRVFPHTKPKLLSDCFSEDVWSYMSEHGGIAQQLRDAGEDFVMVAEAPDYRFDGNVIFVPINEFTPYIAKAKGNIYYHGYWINRDWFKNEYNQLLRDELQFVPLQDDKNKRYAESIIKSASIALHIRRGDFVRIGWDASIETYQIAIRVMRERVQNAHFFVFSDEIEWCKAHMKQLGLRNGEVTFVEGNVGKSSYIDMQLMTYCKNVILAHSSSFSYLATLLNVNDEVLVYNTTNRQV